MTPGVSMKVAVGLGALALVASLALEAAAQPAPAAAPSAPAAAAAPPAELSSETVEIAKLAPLTPDRIYAGTAMGGVMIVDALNAKLEGVVSMRMGGVFAVPPDAKEIYVSETNWTQGNRGTRLDTLGIYDGESLELKHEIKLPGRLIAGGRRPYFNLSADGRRGYVFNLEPATSVITVDLPRRKVLSEIEIPGCGLIYPFKNDGFATLCADGSAAAVLVDERGRSKMTRTAAFFDGENDPVFEESPVDRQNGRALFISYTGKVYAAELGAEIKVAEPWSLQEAAGLSAATTKPDHMTWRPGGQLPFAWHPASGRLYVLMHMGKHWSQKAEGRQIWVVDTKTKQVLHRLDLPTSADAIAVSQAAEPSLYAFGERHLWVLNPTTGDILRHMPEAPMPGHVAVAGF